MVNRVIVCMYGLAEKRHWKFIGKNNENQYKNNIFII